MYPLDPAIDNEPAIEGIQLDSTHIQSIDGEHFRTNVNVSLCSSVGSVTANLSGSINSSKRKSNVKYYLNVDHFETIQGLLSRQEELKMLHPNQQFSVILVNEFKRAHPDPELQSISDRTLRLRLKKYLDSGEVSNTDTSNSNISVAQSISGVSANESDVEMVIQHQNKDNVGQLTEADDIVSSQISLRLSQD